MLNKKLTKKRSQLGGNQKRKREREINKLKGRILESLEKNVEIFNDGINDKNIYNKNASKLCRSTSKHYPDCEDRKIQYLNKDIQICKYDNDKKKCSKLNYTKVLDKKKQIKTVRGSNLQKEAKKQRKQAQKIPSTSVNFGNDPLTKILKQEQDTENQEKKNIANNLQRISGIIKSTKRQRNEAQKKQKQYKALQNSRTLKINKKNKKRKKRSKKKRQAEAQLTKKVKITCTTDNDCKQNFKCVKNNIQNTDGTCIQIKEISKKNTTNAKINSTSEETHGNTPKSNKTPKLNTEQKEPQNEKFKKIIMGRNNIIFNSLEFTEEDKNQFESIIDEIFEDKNTEKNEITTKYSYTYNSNTINKKIVNTLNQIDGTMICPTDDGINKDGLFDNIFSNISYILKYNFSDENNIKTLKDKVKKYYLEDEKFKKEYAKLNQTEEPKNFDEYIYFILDEHLIYHIYKPETLKVDKSRKKSFESNNTKGKKYTKDYYKILIDTIKGIILEFMIDYNKL